MSRRKLTGVDPLLPETTTTIASLKVTRKTLPSLQKKVFLSNAEGMLVETFESLRREIRRGNQKAIELSLNMHGYVTGKSPTFVANMIQQNSNRADALNANNSRDGFDSLVRRLDLRDATGSTADVIDLEPNED